MDVVKNYLTKEPLFLLLLLVVLLIVCHWLYTWHMIRRKKKDFNVYPLHCTTLAKLT